MASCRPAAMVLPASHENGESWATAFVDRTVIGYKQATFAGPCFLGLMGGQVDHLWADIWVCLTILYFYRPLRLLLETWLGMWEWSNNWQGGVGNGWHGEELRLELSSCYDRGAVVWWMLLLIHQVDGCILHLLFFINSLWELHDILQ